MYMCTISLIKLQFTGTFCHTHFENLLKEPELWKNRWPEYPENFNLTKFWCAEWEYLIERLWESEEFCVF